MTNAIKTVRIIENADLRAEFMRNAKLLPNAYLSEFNMRFFNIILCQVRLVNHPTHGICLEVDESIRFKSEPRDYRRVWLDHDGKPLEKTELQTNHNFKKSVTEWETHYEQPL